MTTDECLEERIKACNTMEALRKQQSVVRDAWTASIREARRVVAQRFSRLIYSEK